MDNKLSIYNLSRSWFDFCFDNPEKVKPNHTALYFFAIEQCNRLGWKEKFGLPTTMAKEAIGIHSYNTFINTLNDLVSFGAIIMIQKSKNQYSSNIIALSNFNKANDKALDEAFIKHDAKQCESTEQSIDSIIIQITNTQLNNIQIESLRSIVAKYDSNKKLTFNFKKSLIELGVNENIVSEYLQIRKSKKAVNTETAFNSIKKEIEKTNYPANDCIQMAVKRSWAGFEAEWYLNALKSKIHEASKDTRSCTNWETKEINSNF